MMKLIIDENTYYHPQNIHIHPKYGNLIAFWDTHVGDSIHERTKNLLASRYMPLEEEESQEGAEMRVGNGGGEAI